MGEASMRKWVRRVLRHRRSVGSTIGPPNGVYAAAQNLRLARRLWLEYERGRERVRRLNAALQDIFGPHLASLVYEKAPLLGLLNG